MSPSNLPPIHDTARLWRRTEASTLEACVGHLRRVKPKWTLSWLRLAALHVLNRSMTWSALVQAVETHVPANSRRSVLNAVRLLIQCSEGEEWVGVGVPAVEVPVGRGFSVKITPVGRFYSRMHGTKRLVALQPRLDFAPDRDQFSIWLSALHYQFCADPIDPLEALILDVSKDRQTGKRRLTRLTPANRPLLSLDELNSRLDLVASCFGRAKEIVPDLPIQPTKRGDPSQGELL